MFSPDGSGILFIFFRARSSTLPRVEKKIKRYSGQQENAPQKRFKITDKCYFIKIDFDLIGGKK
jgi:hypothetical protein